MHRGERVKMKKYRCVLCGLEFQGYGNNADPVKKGKCCNYCNSSRVIPERIKNMEEKNDNKNN